MAKVEGDTVRTSVPEEWAQPLFRSIVLTTQAEQPADAHVEQLFTWVEETAQKGHDLLVANPDADIRMDPEVNTLFELLEGRKAPLFTDDEAMTFVDALPYALQGLAEMVGACDSCPDTDCPMHPSKQRLN